MITVIAATLVLVGASLIYREFFMPDQSADDDFPKPGGVWDGKSPMTRRRRIYTIVFGALGGSLWA